MKEEYLKQEDVVSCETCKCLIKKDGAYIVELNGIYKRNLYYCNKCRPKYKKMDMFCSTGEIFYYKELRVDENGVPIGYKKINN